MNQQEIDYIGLILTEILNNDNIVRKQGEEKLLTIKSQEPDKYACYLVAILGNRKCPFSSILFPWLSNHPSILANYTSDIKSLAAVIIRRNISSTSADSQDTTNQENNVNLWKKLTPDAQNFVKSELLKVITDCSDKTIIHKICNLLIEVGGTIYE